MAVDKDDGNAAAGAGRCRHGYGHDARERDAGQHEERVVRNASRPADGTAGRSGHAEGKRQVGNRASIQLNLT